MLTQSQFSFWRDTLKPEEFWTLAEGEAILERRWYVKLEDRPKPRPIQHGRTELSIRREAAQIAQRRMWGEY